MGTDQRGRGACMLVCSLIALTPPAQAATEFHLGPARINLGGNLHTLTGLQTYRFAAGTTTQSESAGIHAAIARLEWTLPLGAKWQFEAHQRLSWLALSSALALPGAGSGITPAPERAFDLRTQLVNENGVLLEHDVDRLSLHYFGDRFDLALGRQGITWGTSQIFPVADVWAAFSPYDLDTTQKRGVDAVRVVASFGERVELEGVCADRGHADELSGGLRLTYYADTADLYLAPGRYWDRLGLAAGASWARSDWLLRGEAALFHGDEDTVLRGTAGTDWFIKGDLAWTLEGHWNGDGAAEGTDLPAFVATSEPLQRGEIFLLRRVYAGSALLWQLHPTLGVNGSALLNLQDPSALLSTAFDYAPSQETHISGGVFWGVGDPPTLDPLPHVESEYGAYGRLFYLQVSVYL